MTCVANRLRLLRAVLGGELGWVGLKFLFFILLHFRVVRVGDRFYGKRDEVYNQHFGVDRPMGGHSCVAMDEHHSKVFVYVCGDRVGIA